MRSFLLSIGAALLVACASNDEAAAPPPGTPEPTTPVPPDPCAEGQYRHADGACGAFPALAVARSPVTIAPIRDHHASIVVETSTGPFLYVFGGTDDWKSIHADVQRARIGDDGSLGAFEPAGALPQPRAGHCIVQVKDKIFIGGGVVAGGGKQGPTKGTLVVTLGADGKLAEATPGPDMPISVMHLSCELEKDNLYVFGGRMANSHSSKMSARAKLGADGAPGAFQNTTALVPDRSHHASLVHAGRVWIIGGITGDPSADFEDHKDVISAPILEGGALGEWIAAGTLPKTLSVSAAKVVDNAVYLFGGLEGYSFTDKIQRATWNDDGTLSAFTVLPQKLPGARGHVHQLPLYKGHVYSIGGKTDSGSLGTVDIATFTK